MQHFFQQLKQLTTNPNRNIARHSIALLRQLQALNPQDND